MLGLSQPQRLLTASLQVEALPPGRLRLQRFVFGGQLGTFEHLGDLAEAVRVAYADKERLATDAPPAAAAALGLALAALGQVGYPFEVPDTPKLPSSPGIVGRDGRSILLDALRSLAEVALPAGAEVLPVGSFAWGADAEGSDLDVVITSEGGADAGPDALDRLLLVLQQLQSEGRAPSGLEAAELAMYGRTSNVPVLAIRAQVEGEILSADVCTAGQLGSVRDAILFRHMFMLMPTLCGVLQLLKAWLRIRAVPTSSEGGYPQIFWMRLAARTCQQAGGACAPAAVDVAGAADATGSVPALSGLASPAYSEDASAEQLRRFCSRWSRALPGWGELLNLLGEEPSSVSKRLASGVYGATVLVCMRELRNLASAEKAEDLPPVVPHQYLCPAKADFWAAFLVPLPGSAAAEGLLGGTASAGTELVAARVTACSGPHESVRRCCCAACSVGAGAERHPVEYLSRRDGEWAFTAEVVEEVNELEQDGQAPDLQACPPRKLGLAPPHFICRLDGDPASSATAREALRGFRELLAEAPVTVSLPPPYLLHRYSRRLLLETMPTANS